MEVLASAWDLLLSVLWPFRGPDLCPHCAAPLVESGGECTIVVGCPNRCEWKIKDEKISQLFETGRPLRIIGANRRILL